MSRSMTSLSSAVSMLAASISAASIRASSATQPAPADPNAAVTPEDSAGLDAISDTLTTLRGQVDALFASANGGNGGTTNTETQPQTGAIQPVEQPSEGPKVEVVG